MLFKQEPRSRKMKVCKIIPRKGYERESDKGKKDNRKRKFGFD